MPLSSREKIVALVSNGIAVYSMMQKRGGAKGTMYDFVLRAIPEDARDGLDAELIDEVFGYVSSAHSS